ncbi:GAF and ANTAR domain-containing protein [Actinoplanes sp. CA-252034]|uniref:GAF and ANTAR domain-containing protein n=1 Tax=Actinoplanes sp. CA-252034 TaxID=3239906 RepID=UPI003D96865C
MNPDDAQLSRGPVAPPACGTTVSDSDDPLAGAMEHVAQQPAAGAPGGVVGALQRLCKAAAGALAASGTGVSVMAEDGARGIAAASDPISERIEELQFVLGEGPCIDAFASRRPVLVPDLTDGAAHRWPAYTPAAHDEGVRAVFAFPLQVGAARLGVLDVFRARAGRLSGDQLRQAFAFTDLAVKALLDGQDDAIPGAAADGLDEAIEHSPELFQAQGMVMVQLGVPLAEALVRIRAHTYVENRRLNDVARDIVARRLRFDTDHS